MITASRVPVSIVVLVVAVLSSACNRTTNERVVGAYIEAAAAYDAGKLESSLASAKKTLAMDTAFLPALVLVGKASYFLDDDTAAIAALERGVKLSPRSGEAALWLSRAYRAIGRIEDATRTCEILLSSDPANMAALRLAADLALDAGNTAEAYGFLDRAIAAAAEAGLAFADRAALRWASGDREGTFDDLAAAIAVLPRDTVAYKAALELRKSIADRSR